MILLPFHIFKNSKQKQTPSPNFPSLSSQSQPSLLQAYPISPCRVHKRISSHSQSYLPSHLTTMPASTPLYQPAHPTMMPRATGKPAPRGGMHPAPFRPAGSPPTAVSYAPASWAPSASSSAVPSLTNGSYSYARSTGSEDSGSAGTSSIDLIDLMTERISTAVNPLPMDRSIAGQAQT